MNTQSPVYFREASSKCSSPFVKEGNVLIHMRHCIHKMKSKLGAQGKKTPLSWYWDLQKMSHLRLLKRAVWCNDRQTVTLNSGPAANLARALGGRVLDAFITHRSLVKWLHIKAPVKRAKSTFYSFPMARLTPRRQSSVNTFSNTEGAGFPWHRPKQACVLAWGVRVLTHCSEEREAFQGWAPGTCAHPPPPVRSQTRENPQSRAQIPSENDSGCIRAMWVMEPLKPYSIEHGCGRFSLEKINQLLPNSRRSHLKKINKYASYSRSKVSNFKQRHFLANPPT